MKPSERIRAKMEAIAAKRNFKIDIEPMFECLHGRRCRHLDAPGKVSPMCEIAVDGVFNLRACPLGGFRF